MSNIDNTVNKYFNLLVFIAVVAISIFYIFYANIFFPYTMDDSFISYRYADNLANSYGLVFNKNEMPRAEGITSPLYALILSFGAINSFDLLVFSKIFGLTSLLIILITMFQISQILLKQYDFISEKARVIFSIIPILIYISDPYIGANAVSGMETMLGTALLLLFIYVFLQILLCGKNTKPQSILLGFIAFLVPLVRPELTLSVLALFGISYWLLPQFRKILFLSISIFFTLGIIYFFWRYYYYGLLLPLPFYIKQGGFGLAGYSNVGSFILHYGLPFTLLLISILAIPRQNKKLSTAIIIILTTVSIQLFYYLLIHHVMGFGYRYFQPLIPVGILLGTLVLPLLAKEGSRISFFHIKYLSIFILIIVSFNLYSFKKASELYLEWYAPLENKALKVAKVMSKYDEKYTIAINDCGVLPYYTKWEIIDLAGLNNRNIALGHSRETTLSEVKVNNPDLIVLVGKKEHGELTGWERINENDVVELGYSYLGNIALGKNYHWLLYGQKQKDYNKLIKLLETNNIITLK